MSNYLWILDAGHGGLTPNGHYTTGQKKMFVFPDGFTIYEGVVNREITELVYKALIQKGIEFSLVYDNVEDTSLEKRVAMANKIYAKDKRAIYVSIHSNAGGGSGFEIFTSPGQTKSDKVAHVFCELFQKNFSDFKFRKDLSDGDADKEADFYVLRKTDCPAILLENLFFDNRKEAEYLKSEAGKKKIADCIVEAIEVCEKIKSV